MVKASARIEWPSVGQETAVWRVARDAGLSRRQVLANQGQYTAAIPAMIAAHTIALPADVVADLDEATASLVRLDARIDALLSADHDLAPLQSVLLRTESASSSQIEGLTVDARALALATLGARSGPNAAMVVANVHAMEAALTLADAPGVDAILVMHESLMGGQDRHTPGRLRVEQVWIGAVAGPRTATFVPPLHERVPAAMQDLESFMRRADIAPLAHAALAHAQFETIHPFTDGNGRTGRAIVHAMLRHSGAARRVALPISAGLLTDPEGYFAALTAYRHGDALPILTTLARSTRQAAQFGGALVDDLTSTRNRMRHAVRVRADSTAWPTIDLLLAQPLVNVKMLVERLAISERTAGAVLATLETAGVLTQTSAGRRNRVWQCDAVLEALDAFADRIRRARV